MVKYEYKAINERNRKYSGEMMAQSKAEVENNIRARGMTPIAVMEAKKKTEEDLSIWERDINTSKDVHDVKISKKRMLTFFHQMALMMKSGISLSIAMEVMIDTEKEVKMRRILREISSNLYNGITLSASMGTFKTFPIIFVNIIQSGESNGRLDTAFTQCAELMKKEIKLSGKIKSAMMYPIFLLILTIALIIVMSTVVLPSFSGLFTSFGSDLPAMTKITMGISDVMVNYGWLIILIIVAIVITLTMLKRNNYNFAMWWATFQLKIPIIGEVIRLSHLARFSNMMATLSESGVNILQSLELSRDVIGNKYMKDCLNQVIEDVKIGTPINVSMARYKKVFDSLFVSMVRVGEESGMLSESLVKMASMYEEQSTEATNRLTEAMTPAMTIIIAVIVGFTVISIVTAMFGMYDVIAQ